jgi:hypothetical protein
LDKAIEWLEGVEILFGGVVVFGVLLSVAFAALHFPYDSPWERWGPTTGDAFVGLGVLGEIVASARMALCDGELTRRSSERLADAEKEAADARLETERLRAKYAWRTLGGEQMGAMINALRSSPSTVTISFVDGDIESAYFVNLLANAFRVAWWRVNLQAAAYGLNPWYGIVLPRREDGGDDRTELISRALSVAGIGHNFAPIPMWSRATLIDMQSLPTTPPQPLSDIVPTLIFVGPKPLYVE